MHSSNCLVHYGRKGMKWHKHIFDTPEDRVNAVVKADTNKDGRVTSAEKHIYEMHKSTDEFRSRQNRYPSILKSGKGNTKNFSKWSRETFINLSIDAIRESSEYKRGRKFVGG